MTTKELTRRDLDRLVGEVAEAHGLTVEEFKALGQDDALDDDELRDLWLMTKAILLG